MQTTSTPANFAQLARAATSDAILHGPVAVKQHVWQALCEERGIRLNPENLMLTGHVVRREGSGLRSHAQPSLRDVLDDAAPRIRAAVAARFNRTSA